jgi:hypothetical protein
MKKLEFNDGRKKKSKHIEKSEGEKVEELLFYVNPFLL